MAWRTFCISVPPQECLGLLLKKDFALTLQAAEEAENVFLKPRTTTRNFHLQVWVFCLLLSSVLWQWQSLLSNGGFHNTPFLLACDYTMPLSNVS